MNQFLICQRLRNRAFFLDKEHCLFSHPEQLAALEMYRAACEDMDRVDLFTIYDVLGAAELLQLQLSNTRSDPRGILMLSIRKHLHDLG